MDHIESALMHLLHRDVTFVAISRAPIEQIQAAQQRMGWSSRWVSSLNSDFNYDFHASFRPEDVARGEVYYNYAVAPIPVQDLSGFSVFYKDEKGDIYLTYASFGRGQETLMTTYMMLDMTPKGRNETQNGNMTEWVRPHDRYGAEGYVDGIGQFHETKVAAALLDGDGRASDGLAGLSSPAKATSFAGPLSKGPRPLSTID